MAQRVDLPCLFSSQVELAEEATEDVTGFNPSGGAICGKLPEPLTARVGDTQVSVQHQADSTQILAGIFPDTAILTLHNSELEVLPQAAYKLPRGAERVLMMGKKMMVVSTKSGTISDGGNSARGFLHVISSKHSELHLEGAGTAATTSGESVFQSFSLAPGELVLALHPIRRNDEDHCNTDASCEVPDQQLYPSPLSSTSSSNSSPSSTERESSTNFCNLVSSKLESLKKSQASLFGPCLVVTSRGVYLLKLDQDPISTFMEMCVRGGDMNKAQQMALAFGLDMKELIELAADIRLCEKDFTGAISLYRQAGCKHLRAVLKFACSGHIQELLSYLTVLFNTPNLEVSPADRIHLSNLALMAYFQQVLTMYTPVSRAKFQSLIQTFLDQNTWFDECLAVRMATETREWDLLNHVSRSRGLNYEMVESIISILMGKGSSNNRAEFSEAQITSLLQDMGSVERNCLLACVLQPENVESVAAVPELGKKFLGILKSVLPLLEVQGLRSILQQCGPDNPGLRSTYIYLLEAAKENRDVSTENDDEAECGQFSQILLSLFISALLLILKKQGKQLQPSDSCDNTSSALPRRYLSLQKTKQSSNKASENPHISLIPVSRKPLAAGASHVLLQRKESVVSWGATSHGVLGHGASGSRYSTAKAVSFFSSSSKVKVLSVSCGKAHSLALTDCGLYCWGSSKHGQLGLGPQRLNEQRPCLVKRLANKSLSAISAGAYHTLALDSKGKVWSWGWGVHGQLGTGEIEDEFEPRRIRFHNKSQVKQISAGYAHSLLLTVSGEVWVFGCALFGQLGNGDSKKSTTPIRVDLSAKACLISCGYFHNIVVDETDTVFTWGCNPQVLRLEAQQKKRERLQNVRKEMEEQQAKEQVQQQQEQQQPRDGQGSVGNHNNSSLLKDIKKQARQALDDIRNYDGNSQQPSESGDGGGTSVNKTDGKPMPAGTGPTPPAENDMLHLVPAVFDTKKVNGRIVDVSCGNQHSLLLTDQGQVYAFGRNMDGQLGINSRKESKLPTLVTALSDDIVCQIACGGDYSLALCESGTVFAWGNNGAGQCGKIPLDDPAGESGANKVVVMKTTRRIIRLQNNMQNSCDIPKPVSGITSGVYSDEYPSQRKGSFATGTGVTLNESIVTLSKVFKTSQQNGGNHGHLTKLLHLTLEVFHSQMDTKKLIKKCLVSENLAAAAKLSLLAENILQAFEFTLQMEIKHQALSQGQDPSLVCDRIFKSFLFYLHETKDDLSSDAEAVSSERRQLVERLIACWQDQKFSFLLLEKLILQLDSDPLVLQTLVLALFRPEDEEEEDLREKRHSRGPTLDQEWGPKLVDLFTPEFCLRVGDTFVREIQAESNIHSEHGKPQCTEGRRKASIMAGEWLKQKKANNT